MLVSMAEILQQAKEGHYGVPALSAVDELSLRACVEECPPDYALWLGS